MGIKPISVNQRDQHLEQQLLHRKKSMSCKKKETLKDNCESVSFWHTFIYYGKIMLNHTHDILMFLTVVLLLDIVKVVPSGLHPFTML